MRQRIAPILRTLPILLFLSACAAWHPPKPQMPPRDSITAGQQITVRGDQNIYALAMVHKVPMREIIVLNNLQPPYRLRSGQKITLPATAAISEGYINPEIGTASSSVVSASPSLAATAVESVTLDPIPVTKNETPPPALQATKPDTTAITGSSTGLSPVDTFNTPKPAAKPVITTTTSRQTEPASKPIPHDKPEEQAATTASDDNQEDSAPDFRWPLDGPITSSFGPKGGGRSNDGVNIAAPKGAPVIAAAGGTVVYAGNEMKGFGNLILIRHSEDWVTAYAHLDRMLVTKDNIVAKGDMIGRVGKTGNVTTPQLHFEIRRDSKPVNPKDYVK